MSQRVIAVSRYCDCPTLVYADASSVGKSVMRFWTDAWVADVSAIMIAKTWKSIYAMYGSVEPEELFKVSLGALIAVCNFYISIIKQSRHNVGAKSDDSFYLCFSFSTFSYDTQ